MLSPGVSALAAAAAGGVPAGPGQPLELANVLEGPPPTPDVDALLGTSIGSFKITRKLGVGGMGTVYLGEQAAIGSKVAIKVLHQHLCSNPSLVQRFYAEARAANVIGHEHIISIIDLNVLPPNRYYFVMEYLEGKALNELPRPMGHALLVHILGQACDALQAAHVNGVVHRDLKPENIILVRRGRNDHFVKLLDFGIAKLFATELAGQQTVAGMIMGTPEFMAPEQTSGELVDGRTDLYALGVIAYELATGRLPFTSPNLADLFIAHRTQEPTPPHVVNPSVPPALSQAILRALAKAPDARYRDADAFREALEASLEGVAPYRAAVPPSGALPAPAQGISQPPPVVEPAPGRPPTPASAPAAWPAAPASARPSQSVPWDLPDALGVSPAWNPVVAAPAPAVPPSPAPAAPPGRFVPPPPGAPGHLPATPTVARPSAGAPGFASAGFTPPPPDAPGALNAFATAAVGFSPPAPGSPGALQATSTPAHGVRLQGTPLRTTPGVGHPGVSSLSGEFRNGEGGLAATSMKGPFRSSPSGQAPAASASQPGTSSPSRSTPNPRPEGSPALEVRLYEGGKGAFRVLPCTDVSRSGMFVHAESGLPPVLGQVKLGLLVAGRELALTGEVVRHVTPEQSRAWGMAVGFGVQLTQLTPQQKEALAALARGPGSVPSVLQDVPDDDKADAALAAFRKHGSASFYELLGVVDDADFPEVRQKVRDVKRSLEELRTRPLSMRQRAECDAYDRRLDEAHSAIGQPRNRLDYDGARGNWKGAARCIAGGVSVTELDNARKRYLASHERVEGNAHLHFTTGSAWENQKDLPRAQQEFERALALDPLNLTFHQRYQALRRLITTPPAPSRRR